MGKIKVLLIIVLLTTVCSCKKDTSGEVASIEGSWELAKVTGGRPTINYAPGNGNVLKFTNSNYEEFENGRLVKSGRFTLVEDPTVESSVCLSIPAGQYKYRIIYDNDNNGSKSFMQIFNDTLSILRGCFAIDAGSETKYVRR